MSSPVQALLFDWLQTRLSSSQWDWLQQQLEAVQQSNSDKALFVALGMAPRKLGKLDLSLSDAELARAHGAHTGWHPNDWSVDAAARVLILLTVAAYKPEEFTAKLSSLCATADVLESVTYYKAMDLFPEPASFEQLIGEGLRTNMRAVFEAIAHNNAFPLKHFDDHRWNHMILKALFVESALHPIRGLDQRANPELAGILCQYAHERWSANRSVTPELWRCVGPHATVDMLADLARASLSSDPNEHAGAMLALSHCPLSEAAPLLAAFPETSAKIAAAELSWDTLSNHINITEQPTAGKST